VNTRVLTLAIFNERAGWTLPERALSRLREAAPGSVEVRLVGTRQQLLDAMPETDYLAGFPFTESQFLELDAPRVRWIQLTGRVGESVGKMRAILQKGVRVTTSARARAPQCAEHALMLTLALFRGTPAAARAQAEHRWAAGELAGRVRELGEAVIGVVGGGAVGCACATLLTTLGCETIMVTGGGDEERLTRPEGVDTLPLERLDEILTRVDALIIACPFPNRSHPIVRRSQLQAMKERSFLVDVSRDGLVDEQDLIRALQREEIAGAGLDVFEHAPPAADSPLWTMPNVIVTPSISAASPRYWDRAADLIGANLRRIESEERLLDEMRFEPEPARAGRR
jgi:phosphoglycerate dehydrogenase-like enzyme